MNYLLFGKEDAHRQMCIVSSALHRQRMLEHLIDPFGIQHDMVFAVETFKEKGKKKPAKALLKEWVVNELVPTLVNQESYYVVCTDAEVFKILTGQEKADAMLGYVLNCALLDGVKAIYCPSHMMAHYDPIKVPPKIEIAMNALLAYAYGKYEAPGTDIIKYESYPTEQHEIKEWLDRLLEMDCDLTCDIEAFSLKHYTAGIGTITFCWNQHEGIAFPVDYVPLKDPVDGQYGEQVRNEKIRVLLADFFIEMQKRGRKLIYHHIAYDAYVLIYQLFMKDLLDTEGLLHGLEVMCTDFDDTKLIAYLCLNSCAGNELGLKALSQEYAGNWAESEIVDIRRIPLDRLLRYNLIDGLSTWYAHSKYRPMLDAEQQVEVYEDHFKPYTVDIIQMQLTGMPLDRKRTLEVEKLMQAEYDTAKDVMINSKLLKQFQHARCEDWVVWKNSTLKKKRVDINDAYKFMEKEGNDLSWNPNSGPQMQIFLYDYLKLPVLDTTETGQPSTKAKILEALLDHTDDPDVLEVLNALLNYGKVNKILTSFIPAMLEAPQGPDGWYYLFGKFNLGGTVSGRLSSNDPNLQNLPANSIYGALIKSCFAAPEGWLFVGLDFNALEDRISAVTTKDPNKLAVYTMGFDGHCLRTYAYFPKSVPDIERAPEGAKCFAMMVGDRKVYFHSDEQITYLGEQMTGQQLADKLSL